MGPAAEHALEIFVAHWHKCTYQWVGARTSGNVRNLGGGMYLNSIAEHDGRFAWQHVHYIRTRRSKSMLSG